MPYLITVDKIVNNYGERQTTRVKTQRGMFKGELVAEPFPNQNVLHLSLSRTINLGDYNSLKVEISVSREYGENEHALEQVYKTTSDWLVDKFVSTVKSIAPKE